jgi:hypothetical protein
MAATPGVGATYKAREVEEGYGSIKQLVISTASIFSMGSPSNQHGSGPSVHLGDLGSRALGGYSLSGAGRSLGYRPTWAAVETPGHRPRGMPRPLVVTTRLVQGQAYTARPRAK